MRLEEQGFRYWVITLTNPVFHFCNFFPLGDKRRIWIEFANSNTKKKVQNDDVNKAEGFCWFCFHYSCNFFSPF